MQNEPPSGELDCKELRRRLLIDPHCREPAFLTHIAGCRECAAAAAEAQRLERQLERALRVDPPPGLERRVIDAWRAGERAGRPAVMPVIPLVATLVLALGLVVFLRANSPLPPETNQGLARQVLEHIRSEPDATRSAGTLGYPEIARVVRGVGGELTGDLGRVSHAGVCRMAGERVAHLVLRGRHGAVTLLILPGVSQPRITRVQASGLLLVILPTGYGSLAVAGASGEPVEDFAERARRALLWSG